jgi:pimeloyl-ACP methyl ester carboxylesterase
MRADTTSAAFVSRIESVGTRAIIPCEAGAIVWRIWGEGPPLVLLHGASGSWTHWIRNVLPLAAWFRVLVPDMPGYGDSDAPPEPHTADGLADLVASGVNALLPPPTSLDLAGFSLGGIIAGLVAARLGRRLRTLVLLGTGGLALGGAPTRPLVRIRSAMRPDEVRHVYRENLKTLMIASNDKVDDLAVFLQMESVRRARFKSEGIPESDSLLKALPAIRARVTSIWGSRDAFMGSHLEDCRRILASGQRGPDFRVIEGAGHWTPYEAADQVNAILIDMLR